MSRFLKCQEKPCGRATSAFWTAAAALLFELLAASLLAQGPQIVTQPQNQFVPAGGTAMFDVSVSGSPPFFYRWFGPAGPIPFGTNATLKISPVDLPDRGIYYVNVSNSVSSTQSAGAMLSVMRLDFGDAPDPYPTKLPGGAQHNIVQGVQLGTNITFEPDGMPDPNAAADPGDDGVIFMDPLLPGRISAVRVIASIDGRLNAWIDFDATGDWSAAFDQIFHDTPLHANQNDLSFSVPATAVPGATFARFRFSTQGGLGPTGLAPDGEVEDYRVQIASVADLSVNASFYPNPLPPNSDGQCLLRVVNFGPHPASNVVISNILTGADILSVQSDADVCATEPGRIGCMISNLPPNQIRSLSVIFHPLGPAVLTNTLTVRSAVFDPDTSNNKSVVTVRAADPLLITKQPQNQRVIAGGTASFSVEAKGVGALSYQWEMNGALLPTETASTLTLYNVQDSAQVRAQVTDAFGSVWSDPAMLTVVKPPQIIAQPLPINVSCNGTAGNGFVLQVQVDGTPPFRFQWRLNGENIRGATNQFYAVNNPTRADGGAYTAVVGNEAGITVSEKATVICSDIPRWDGSDSMANPAPLPPPGLPGTSPIAGVISFDNCSATLEVGEPRHADRPGGHSVWYQWIAPADGIATFDTIGSAFDTLIGIYQRTTSGTLSNITSDEDSGGFRRSLAKFNALANMPYLIVVDGFNGQCGPFVLAWSFEPLQANQPFLPNITVHPMNRSGPFGSAIALSVDATPFPTTTQLFYQWLFNGAPIQGGGPIQGVNSPVLQIANLNSNLVGTYSVRIFSGSTGSNRYIDSHPTTVEIGPVPCIQSVDKLEDLLLNCGGFPNGGGPGLLSSKAKTMSGGSPPFIPVSLGIPGSQTLNNTNSTSDIDCFFIGNATRWLGITVDANGSNSLLRIDTVGSAIATEIGIYRFTFPSCLQNPVCMHANLVACDTNSGGGSYSLVQFPPLPGGEYIAFMDGVDGAQGIINCNWILGRPPVINPAQSNCTLVVLTNTAVTLSSGVTNASPTPTYQWSYYGTIMTNQTNSTISFPSIQSLDAGCYSVVVSNSFGIVTNQCCLIVNPPLLRCQSEMTNDPPLCHLWAALLPDTVLQCTTNVTPAIAWQNVATNTTTNCYFQYAAPMFETNGQPIPQRFYRTMKP